MPINRHFLGWDGPIVEKVGAWLLGSQTGADPVDLRGTLIIVPTLQAGRRLKERLALSCHERNTVLLSAAIVTPYYLFSRVRPGLKAANPSVTKAVWTEILEGEDLAEFSAFFPRPHARDDVDKFRWALHTGEIIERLRQELADGGYSISDVIGRHGQDLGELERWNDLARLEKLFLRKMEKLGFPDSCMSKIETAGDPVLDQEVARVVVACVPDPALLAVRAFQELSRDRSIDILVHAPESIKDKFDDWGRPLAKEWAGEEVEIPDWENSVFLEASPDTQANKVVEILSRLPACYGPADIGIGVPDVSVMPFLKNRLRAADLPAFDPSNASLRAHPLGRLVECMFNLLRSHAYAHVADLLRHPDFLHYLDADCGIAPRCLLGRLDEFQNSRLPVSLENMLEQCAVSAGRSPAARDDFAVLEKALMVVKGYVDAFESSPLEEAWRSFLQSVYRIRMLRQDDASDMEFQQVAGSIEGCFRELREIPGDEPLRDNTGFRDIFFRRLQEQSYSRERADAVLDLQGWLELPWTDTPVLIVTGMNEEFVPGGVMGGVFLPDSLRKVLRLRDDSARLGRDLYLLKSMVESRRRDGKLFIIVGKNALSGDPLRPSRLLFRCKRQDVPARARQLFKRVAQAGRTVAAETIFRLKPAACDEEGGMSAEKTMNVTAFRDYLACPFRFYLRHVLGMEALSDDKSEPDALDFGLLVHEVLQVMGEDRKLWACRDDRKLGRALAGMADEAVALRYGKNPSLGVMAALSAARARLEALAGIQVGLTKEGWEVVAAEQKKSVVRKGFVISGKIDRIDRHRDSGLIRIIDYKTSNKPELPHAAHLKRSREKLGGYNECVSVGEPGKKRYVKERIQRWVDLQLPLYYLLYNGSDAFKPGIEPAYFNLPRAAGETGISTWNEFDGELLASAFQCADGVLDDIAGRRFWPPSESVHYDEFESLFTDAPEKVFNIEGFPS